MLYEVITIFVLVFITGYSSLIQPANMAEFVQHFAASFPPRFWCVLVIRVVGFNQHHSGDVYSGCGDGGGVGAAVIISGSQQFPAAGWPARASSAGRESRS